MQTTVRYHFTSIRMAFMKQRENSNCEPGCHEIRILCTVHEGVKWCVVEHLTFPQNLKHRKTMWPSNTTSGCIFKGSENGPRYHRPWRRARHPLQYSCLENPHGQRSLAGNCPWCRKESDTAKHLSTAPRKNCPGLGMTFPCLRRILGHIPAQPPLPPLPTLRQLTELSWQSHLPCKYLD